MDTTQMLYLAGAFVLGFIVAWFAGRNGPKRALEECEANAHSLQRSLDERTRSVSKLEGQLKEQVAQADRLGNEQGKLSTALKAAEQSASDAAAQIAQLQDTLSQSESDRLRLESELGHIRGAYADTRTRLAELFEQNEAQTAAAAAAAQEAETTALALAGSGQAEQVEQLTAQVQSLESELEAVRANAARLAGQVALRPELSSTKQQEYAALAGDAERVVAALHQRDMQVADARAEADYLRRTVGMLTGMGAELAQEVERRRREQHLLAYQVAGLTAVTRESEFRQLVDRQAASAEAPAPQTPTGTIEAESHDLPVTTQPDNALETDDRGVALQTPLTPTGTIEAESHDLPVTTRPDNALEPEESDAEGEGQDLAALALDLRQQLEERTKELESLREQAAPLQANLDELQAEIEALNAANADLETQLETRDGDLTELQNKLAELYAESERAAAAKAALAEKLQVNGAAWGALVSRVQAVNSDLDAFLAEEPAEEETTAPAEEIAALAATAPAEPAVPEAARAADAVAPAAEVDAEGEASTETAEGGTLDAKPALDKLAAGVAAAVALFRRKNARLAEYTQQVDALAADKQTLEATLATKADVEMQLDARSSELADLQAQLAELQTQSETVGAAKAELETSLQGREAAWNNLLARVQAVNSDLDALLAAEPAEIPAAEEPTAAEAVAPEAAAADSDAEAASDTAPEAAAAEDPGKATLDKLAAGVAAAVALFRRKNANLAEHEQRLSVLAGDKGVLESTVAAKDQALIAAQARFEELQTGLNQRSQRFDALSMHTSSLEADAEIRKIEQARLEEQVRAVAAELQALAQSETPAAEAEAEAGAETDAEASAGQPAPASTLDELAAAAAAVTALLRDKDAALQAAHAELGGLQTQLADYDAAKQSLAAELESRGAGLAEVETRLQALQGEYTGVEATRGDLAATLKSLGEQLRGYLAEYGEPAEEAEPQAAVDAAVDAAAAPEAAEMAAAQMSPAAAMAAVAAVGELLKRRKDSLDEAGTRIGDLDAEISAMTSQRSEMDTLAEQQEQELADLKAQLEAAQAELATHTTDAEALKQQIADLTAQQETTQAELATRAADADALTAQLADVTAQLEVAQADLTTHTTEADALKQQVADVTAQLEAAQADLAARSADADALQQQLADVTAQLEAAQADVAQRITDADTLKNQLASLQAEAAASEQERLRLDAQLRVLDENLAQFGAALDADDETTLAAITQKLGASEAPADATRSIDVPLIKAAGAVTVAGIAGKKLAALKQASEQLSVLQQEHTALAATRDELQGQLASQTAALEGTKTQLADLQAQSAAANAQHADEIQVLDAKTVELQNQYNEAEATRLRLEASLATLNQELAQLGTALETDDDAPLQQFAQRAAPSEASEETGEGNGSGKVLGVAAVAAALQRKQATLKESAAKEADARVAAIQAQLDEVSADREAAKTLLADRDQALQEAETKLTEATLQVEAKVSDFKAAARAAAAERGVEVQTVRALQDFADLKHIGVTFEQRLYRAGAGTFWEVAHLTDEDFAIILRLTEMQQLAMDLGETRADAVRMAEETGTVGAISEGETPDDFEPIQGIGKVFEQRLYSAGIRTYWDLANASEEQLAAICKARRPLVPDYAGWIRQARILAEVRSDS